MTQTFIYLIIYIAEALIGWQYFSSIFLSSYKKLTIFSTAIVGYFVLFLISLKEIYWLNTISFFLINAICFQFLFKTNIKKALFHSLILTVAMNVTELLTMTALALVYSDFSAYTKKLSIFVLLAVTSKVLYYLTLQIILRLLNYPKDTSGESSMITVLLCTVPLVSLWITVTLIFIGIEGAIPDHLNWFVSMGAVLILFLNICIFFIYHLSRQDHEKHLQTQLQLQKESADAKYYKMLLIQDENQKILIHDIKKHLYTIADLLDNGHNSRAKEYIKHILQSKELCEKLYFCDNPTLNLILVRYNGICQENNIQFCVDIRKGTISFFNIEEIASLFGNLLDNAVEAATGVSNSYIELSVKHTEANQLMISMINSCSQSPIQCTSGDYVSQKKDYKNHGLGMKSIRNIAKKYQGTLNSFYNKEDQTFHTMVTFPFEDILSR